MNGHRLTFEVSKPEEDQERRRAETARIIDAMLAEQRRHFGEALHAFTELPSPTGTHVMPAGEPPPARRGGPGEDARSRRAGEAPANPLHNCPSDEIRCADSRALGVVPTWTAPGCRAARLITRSVHRASSWG